MADSSWEYKLEKYLMMYFEIQWLQVVNLVLYFGVQILLSVFLTMLPIKLTFNWMLAQVPELQKAVDITVVVMFTLHIYLYLNYKLNKLIRNPQIQKKLLFQNKVVKMRWLNIVTPEFIYDVVCLGIAIYELSTESRSLVNLLLELVYLLKIYKIKIFNDRIQSYIIGTSFYIIYNVFYGLFILIILVSYVGCGFYLIDYLYYQSDYEYTELLWISNSQAWANLIDYSFGVQLLYTMYWSLGTASSAAYGDISGSAPPDVVYNVLCLYFEGFLFGFYLSRIHSLPETISQKQNELLDLFDKFESHTNEIKEKGSDISKELYFKILCSLEYQQSRKKSLNYIESILPQDYIIEIKTHLFTHFINLNPLNLWPSDQLKKKLSLNIVELTTELGEQIYDYSGVDRTDLIFLNTGSIVTYIESDGCQYFQAFYNDKSVLGLFNFLANLHTNFVNAKLNSYSVVYLLKRSAFKAILNLEELVHVASQFQSMVTLQNQSLRDQSIGKLAETLSAKSNETVFLKPSKKVDFINKLFSQNNQKFKNKRKILRRSAITSKKMTPFDRKGKVSVGIQCNEEKAQQCFEKVLIMQ